jgi:NAD(P)-dependent dehydrogenase (short-subunit alcohol dehydrogenase family)
MNSVKNVLITGASGGVGRGIATSCGEAGWTVWIAARRAAEGVSAAEEVDRAGGKGRFIFCDVGDPQSVSEAVAHIVGSGIDLDGVVHNATSGYSSQARPLSEVTLVELEDQVRVNLRGLYLLAQTSFESLRSTGGSLVVLTSEAGFEGKPRLVPYATVKASQRGLARVLAREWGPFGVRVNCVAPLASSPAMIRYCEHPSNRARVMDRIPLGRLGDPRSDIGPAVRYLLSDDSRFVTGQTMMVDGGSCPIS